VGGGGFCVGGVGRKKKKRGGGGGRVSMTGEGGYISVCLLLSFLLLNTRST